MLTVDKPEDLRRLFREDLKAMENGTYIAPLAHPILRDADERMNRIGESHSNAAKAVWARKREND